MLETNILNEKGDKRIILNDREEFFARNLERQIQNALGYEISITSLTAISKRVTEQKFFELRPSDYMPVRVGEGAWSTNIVTYRSFDVAGDFETGIVNTGSGDSRLASADTAIDQITVPVKNWAKQINYTIMDLEFASRSGNWDVVTSKEIARKRNWDLGVQKVAFLGSLNMPQVYGLLSQPDVNSNTTLITGYINAMSDAQYQTFVAGVYEAYRSNANRTAKPDKFIIPEGDYNGLITPVNTNFAITSKLEYLEKAFRTITGNANFKVLPCAYADAANNSGYVGHNRYVLTNGDADSIRMDIPVDYTNTVQNSINGFQFQNVGYGQFTGCKAYRPLETLYFDWGTS